MQGEAHSEPRLPHLRGGYYAPTVEQPQPVPTPSIQAPMGQPQPAQIEQSTPTRIQSETLPRPLSLMDEYVGLFESNGTRPPPVNALYTVKDAGCANPRFLRMTCSSICPDSSSQNSLGVPIAAVWQPFAELDAGDDPLPVIESPPFRCTRCMAYVNPYFKFEDSARKCTCNICGLNQDIPQEFLQNRASKPELAYGAYEFVAPKEYYVRQPAHMIYFFCIDISAVSVNSGLMAQLLSSVKTIVDSVPVPARTEIGVMTFDTGLKFYKPNSLTAEIQEVVINDIKDPFVSEPASALTFNVSRDRQALESFLDKLIASVPAKASPQCVTLSTVASAMMTILESTGGRLLIFSTQLGVLGKDPLQNRDNPALYAGDKEKVLYNPVSENYTNLAKDCSQMGIAIDIFACPTHYIDIASLYPLACHTGGDIHFFPHFNPAIDAERLHYTLFRTLTRIQAFDIMMRARTSNGLAVDHYIGKYSRRGAAEMQAACVDSDKSVVVVMRHDEKMDTEQYIQCAILYTSMTGVRLIRIFNSKITPTSNLVNVYQSIDCDAIANVFARMGVNRLHENKVKSIRENWHGLIVKIFQTYKVSSTQMQIAASQPQRKPTGFSVPETLKLLPLFTVSAMKLPVFSLSSVSSDMRMYSASYLLGISLHSSRLLFYPSIYRVHDIIEQRHNPGTPTRSGTVALPELVICSISSISSDGVYLINNGEILVLVIGENAPASFLYNVMYM
jgi:protein transport protein SEC24